MSIFAKLFGKKNKQVDVAKSESKSNQANKSQEKISLDEITTSTDLNFLANCLVNNEAAEFNAARQQIVELLDDGNIDLAALEQAVTDKSLRNTILSSCKNNDLQQIAIADIDDQQEFFTLAESANSALLRRLAVEKISDIDLLTRLNKSSKGSDKAVYKLTKEKLADIKAFQQVVTDCEQELLHIRESVEHLTKHPSDPQFDSKLDYLEKQFSIKSAELVELDGDLSFANQESFVTLLSACKAEHEKHLRELEASEKQLEQQVESVTTVDEQQAPAPEVVNTHENDDSLELKNELYEFIIEFYNETDLDESIKLSFKEKLNVLIEKIQQLENSKQVSALLATTERIEKSIAQVSEHGGLLKQLATIASVGEDEQEKLLNQLKSSLLAAYDLPKNSYSQVIDESVATITRFKEQQQAVKEKQAEAAKRIAGMIRKANTAIEQGRFRQANGIYQKIVEEQEASPSLTFAVEQRLEALKASIKEYQDWQQYAVAPKLEELVVKMEEVKGNELSPPDKAEKIKSLQHQWKTISKGTGKEYQELWEKFHQFAEAAYEPCKEYFEQQAKIRELHLESRQRLVIQLNDYYENYNWEKADWPSVQEVVKVARADWRKHGPVERKAHVKSKKDFEAALKPIQAKLDEQYALTIAKREDLLKQAEEALAIDNLKVATDKVKDLQSQWANSGIIRHRDDQALWKAFRQHCDAVFAKREQQSAEFKKSLQDNWQQAIHLLDEIRHLTNYDLISLEESESKLATLQKDYANLGTLPKEHHESFAEQWQGLVHECERIHDKQRSLDSISMYEEVLSLDMDIRDNLVSEDNIDSLLAALPSGSEPFHNQLKSKLGSNMLVSETVFSDLQALCLRMEILHDAASPVGEESLRMKVQVERLQQSMNEGLKADTTEGIVTEWLDIIAGKTVIQRYYDRLLKAIGVLNIETSES